MLTSEAILKRKYHPKYIPSTACRRQQNRAGYGDSFGFVVFGPSKQ